MKREVSRFFLFLASIVFLSAPFTVNGAFSFQASTIASSQITVMPADTLSKLQRQDRYSNVRDNFVPSNSVEDYINQYRKFSGLPALTINPSLRTSAQNHSLYLSVVQDMTLNAHYEDPAQPNFYAHSPSDRCMKAGFPEGCSEVIAWNYPDFYSTIDTWMGSPFHRLPLIKRATGEIGCGVTSGWFVCDTGSDQTISPVPAVVYPADGQVIPSAFEVVEIPEPYPQYNNTFIGPTIQYWAAKPIEDIQYGVFNLATGESYDSVLIDPTTEQYAQGAFFFNPKQILPVDSEFVAVVKGTHTDGTHFEKYWSFKSQHDHNTEPTSILSKITYNDAVKWKLTLPLAPGDLIKTSSSASVYYYGTDDKRYVFPNQKTFATWFLNFDGVRTIPDDQMASFPIGGNITYRPGSRLAKITTDPNVYWIDTGGHLRHIVSESAALNLFGADWSSRVDDIPDTFFFNYKSGDVIASGPLPVIPANWTINKDKGL